VDAGSPEAGPLDASADLPSRRSSGCGVDPPTLDDSIQVGAMRGSYLVDLPADYDRDRALPLIMAFHDAVSSAAAFRGSLDLSSAVREGAIVVNLACLNDAVAWDVTRDLPYVDALLVKLEQNYCVNLDRVFAVGHSEGGAFANTLGCLRGDKFRGIAPLSGGPGPSASCKGEVAVWITQGNREAGGGAGRANRDFWVQRNGCEPQKPTPVEPSPCVEYNACRAGSPVRFCEYDGDLDLPDFAADGLWQFLKGLR
jgi:poly(3-hydroxybutyrate) depolymerase